MLNGDGNENGIKINTSKLLAKKQIARTAHLFSK